MQAKSLDLMRSLLPYEKGAESATLTQIQLEDSGEHGQLKKQGGSRHRACFQAEFCAAHDTDASETEQPF